MSDYIVLVKQVPDISQITDNAFDPVKGTLIRSRLTNVINDLDAQALAFANKMRLDSGDPDSKVICLSMGPPMADDILRYSLSRCADLAVLLTDRLLAGADTAATANPLAYAIRKIERDIVKDPDDYFIISGMQSVDGDTAQVPPQIAEELKLPCITYVTDAEYKNKRFEFTRIITGGDQIVASLKKPAVITVAEYEFPLFATFAKTRKAHDTEILKWKAEDINADHIGVDGSRTTVTRVFPPPETTRKCREIKDVGTLADVILNKFSGDQEGEEQEITEKTREYIMPEERKDFFDRTYEGTEKENKQFSALAEILKEINVEDIDEIDDSVKEEIMAKANKAFTGKALDNMLNGLKKRKPSYNGQVWVSAEYEDNKIHPATFELIGKARDLADTLGTEVGVTITGSNIERFSEELIAAGADNIYIAQHPLLEEFDPSTFKKALCGLIEKHWPQIVLFAATPQGRVLAPLVSYNLSCGLTADCTSLDIKDVSKKEQVAVLLQTRPALGGNVMATISTINSRSQMATARPGVMKRLPEDKSRKGKIIRHEVQISPDDLSLEIISTEKSTGKVNFDADIIVSGGKGVQNKEGYNALIKPLSNCISETINIDTETGASRSAVEQGFIDRVHQVGQTGTAVGPKIYMAIGISGAIQHMIGIANSDTIIAVNNDHNAPIFKQCDYYIIGNAEDVVPELIKSLRVKQNAE
ncbi:MAG: FAD-binding protein [Candidatus Krumholzibacteriota bacterium]|nr:FAD-binding protein [Candidatus Krumholzibacteriota bacterium]